MFMQEIQRDVAIINLDFANDHLPYVPAVDVRQLLTLQVVYVSQRDHPCYCVFLHLIGYYG